jgi:hypothetical protein
MVFAPYHTENGGQISIFHGAGVPFILISLKDGDGDILIGDYSIHAIMEGRFQLECRNIKNIVI